MPLILPENKITLDYSLNSIIKSFEGHSINQHNIEKMRHMIMEYVFRKKLALGRDLNRPIYDNFQNIGKYIGSEVIFDQDPLTMELVINYVECYGTATDINAVFENEQGKIECRYFPRAEAETLEEDNVPYWFLWARSVELRNPIEYYRLWV